MKELKEACLRELLRDLDHEVSDIQCYKSAEAAQCAIVTLAKILVVLEDE